MPLLLTFIFYTVVPSVTGERMIQESDCSLMSDYWQWTNIHTCVRCRLCDGNVLVAIGA